MTRDLKMARVELILISVVNASRSVGVSHRSIIGFFIDTNKKTILYHDSWQMYHINLTLNLIPGMIVPEDLYHQRKQTFRHNSLKHDILQHSRTCTLFAESHNLRLISNNFIIISHNFKNNHVLIINKSQQ